MAVDILIGLQWGDEGKGKAVDYIANDYDVIGRFQGGPNAGHTLVINGEKHVLHQIPSGVFRPDILNVIGNGVVLDPIKLIAEIEALEQKGIDLKQNLVISKKAMLISPTHRQLDAAYERYKGASKIGSTLKGIGPTYQDKYARTGLRMGNIFSADFKQLFQKQKAYHYKLLKLYNYDVPDSYQKEEDAFFESIEKLKKYKFDETEYLVNKALTDGKKILAEGAQGTLLDIDFGSYPFVTSSHTISAGVCSGLGVPPNQINEIIGIFKAYCTRVGSGPFPTELDDQIGQRIREQGQEFGATTGRPRRCGWLDMVALKYAIMLNGVTQLHMMKADVLSGFDELNIAYGYKKQDGNIIHEVPFDIANQVLEPVYESIPGWSDNITQINQTEQMPINLLNYVKKIETDTGVPVTSVSTGPGREQTIIF